MALIPAWLPQFYHQDDNQGDDAHDHRGVHRSGAAAFEQLGDAARHGGDDAGQDD